MLTKSRRSPRGEHRARPVTRYHDPVVWAAQRSGALCDGEGILDELFAVIPVRWRVGQTVASHVHGHDPSKSSQAAHHRRPGPRCLGEAMQ